MHNYFAVLNCCIHYYPKADRQDEHLQMHSTVPTQHSNPRTVKFQSSVTLNKNLGSTNYLEMAGDHNFSQFLYRKVTH